VKRLMREACELKEPTEEYWAHPLDDNLFEWHFTVQGPPGTDFEGGVYHGRILLPADYPMRPPNIILMTVLSHYTYIVFIFTLQVICATCISVYKLHSSGL
jgi:ubiquitin-protein ligase